jgi:hypothetical protein
MTVIDRRHFHDEISSADSLYDWQRCLLRWLTDHSFTGDEVMNIWLILAIIFALLGMYTLAIIFLILAIAFR